MNSTDNTCAILYNLLLWFTCSVAVRHLCTSTIAVMDLTHLELLSLPGRESSAKKSPNLVHLLSPQGNSTVIRRLRRCDRDLGGLLVGYFGRRKYVASVPASRGGAEELRRCDDIYDLYLVRVAGKNVTVDPLRLSILILWLYGL